MHNQDNWHPLRSNLPMAQKHLRIQYGGRGTPWVLAEDPKTSPNIPKSMYEAAQKYFQQPEKGLTSMDTQDPWVSAQVQKIKRWETLFYFY